MPTVYTGSYKIPFESGKGLGQIGAEKESYTRGVEQARLDIQKKQIKDAQTERSLARIDADEKETRRQQEWEAIAKRSREAVEESKRRFGIERTELTKAQQLTEDRLRAKEIQDREDFKRLVAGGTLEQVGATGGYDTRNDQVNVQQPQQQGIMGLLAQKQDEWKGVPYKMPEAPAQPEIKSGYTPPSDIADYIDVGSRDVLERIHKKIIPLTPESKAKLKKEASLAAYGRGGTSEQKQANAMSIYNKLLKERKSKNDSAEIEKINKVNEIRTAKRKAEKEGKLTPVQQFSQASKIVESASYGETIYTERQIKWAKDIVAKYTGGAATQEKATQEKWWNK